MIFATSLQGIGIVFALALVVLPPVVAWAIGWSFIGIPRMFIVNMRIKADLDPNRTRWDSITGWSFTAGVWLFIVWFQLGAVVAMALGMSNVIDTWHPSSSLVVAYYGVPILIGMFMSMRTKAKFANAL